MHKKTLNLSKKGFFKSVKHRRVLLLYRFPYEETYAQNQNKIVDIVTSEKVRTLDVKNTLHFVVVLKLIILQI